MTEGAVAPRLRRPGDPLRDRVPRGRLAARARRGRRRRDVRREVPRRRPGPARLVAEWLVGEIARAIGLLVPDIVAVDLDRAIADSEPHQEIHDLLVASVGRTSGVDFLPGAMTFNPAVDRVADPDWAAAVIWLDGLATNPDRSPKNPNLLVWGGRTWLIDQQYVNG